jgi:TetR/AcrR family transcriptional regulator of autoinduction and epiphytic fitness
VLCGAVQTRNEERPLVDGVVIDSTSPHDSDNHVDGRRLRGERTRTRVLEALLALVEEGELHPTAQAVASRAGVALRTVYHHFEDVEALRVMALDVQLDRHRETLHPIERDLPLRERITHVVKQVRKLFEAITPIRRATLFDESDSHEMSDGLRRAQSLRRSFIEQSFKAELDGSEVNRRELLDAIDVTTSWHSWYYLRQDLGRSVNAAEGIVEIQLRTLLDAA